MGNSFIAQFLDYTSDFESPESFFYWAAITTVAAVMRDNVYIRTKKDLIFPNLYTLLLADSAVNRKGNPLRTADSLLSGVGNTKIMSGRASIQAIISSLADAGMNKETGTSMIGGSAIIIADEISAFFSTDPQVIPCLTDIYDSRREYTSNLKGEGRRTIKNLCVSMLAASNETLLKSVYGGDAVYGGLLGRTLFVRPTGKTKPPNSLLGDIVRLDEEEQKRNQLVDNLKKLSALRGAILIDKDAERIYTEWYINLYNSYHNKADRSGIIARIHTTVLKVAIVLGISRSYAPCIERTDMEEAIENCTKLLPNYENFVASTGKADIALAGSLLLKELKECNTTTKRSFMRKHWTDIDDNTFEQTWKTLQSAGIITVSLAGNDMRIALTKEGAGRLNT